MTQTYSEQRQAALFKAARELRLVACSVLDDVQNETELTSSPTLSWAKSVAAKTATMASELEQLAHEQCIAPARANTAQAKSSDHYGKAIDAFQRRILAAGGTLPA